MRIVSLVPSVTSILLALGAGRELVGVSKWCNEVARTGKRPKVGDCWKLDVEEVMQLRPTHVIGSVPFATETVEKILKQPFVFLALNPRTLADIESNILTLGRLVARNSQARKICGQMRGEFRRVSVAAKRRHLSSRPRVYAEAWPNPRISSPPWVAELIEIAGGTMCVPAGARVTDEEIAAAAPEVIFLAWTATGGRSRASTALGNPKWRGVPAIQTGRVFVVRDEWLNTPGPPLMHGARAIFRCLLAAGRS
ncbi:MAG TPA: ABC transporter substrate-binding protein [Verrucomicrobiae bacterium]|nr:ABC transporter substrate-binding protein [Verrucomicrobiae bacterium]